MWHLQAFKEKEAIRRYRTEWKYSAKETELISVREKLSSILSHDRFSNEAGKYFVHSMYFDDIDDTCARKNVAGDGRRFKYRLRYYNNSPSFLLLEKKEKNNAFCYKRSSLIDKETYRSLMAGNVDKLLWSDKQVLKEFAHDVLTRGFMPKVIISYQREAFVEPISNVRITFDSHIVASDDFYHFFDNFHSTPIINDKQIVLEVKFDYVLPAYISEIIQSKQINHQSFSKYFMGRLAIQKNFNL